MEAECTTKHCNGDSSGIGKDWERPRVEAGQRRGGVRVLLCWQRAEEAARAPEAMSATEGTCIDERDRVMTHHKTTRIVITGLSYEPVVSYISQV